MNYNEIIDSLKGLIQANTSAEDAEKIGSIINKVENANKEHDDLINKSEALREKYINAIKNMPVGDKPLTKDETIQKEQPLTFEECLSNVIKERK